MMWQLNQEDVTFQQGFLCVRIRRIRFSQDLVRSLFKNDLDLLAFW